jgi:hypothetical protein
MRRLSGGREGEPFKKYNETLKGLVSLIALNALSDCGFTLLLKADGRVGGTTTSKKAYEEE